VGISLSNKSLRAHLEPFAKATKSKIMVNRYLHTGRYQRCFTVFNVVTTTKRLAYIKLGKVEVTQWTKSPYF